MSDTNTTNTPLEENLECPAVGYQAVSVNVPVTVSPYAKTGVTSTKCCGAPIINSGTTIASGTENGVCNFTIGQNLVVAIPVAFGADATVGSAYVDALEVSSDEIDCENFPTIPDTETQTQP